MGEEITVCVFCEKRIWKDTHGWRHERSGSMPICNSTPEPKTTITCPQCEGVPDMCNGYCEGTGTVTTTHAVEWHRQNNEEQPKAAVTAEQVIGAWQATFKQHNLLSTATDDERRSFIGRNMETYNRLVSMMDGREWPIQRTLADFAGSGKAFKRPHHALVFAFMETSGFLKEFDVEEGNPTLARLTAEDLTATDWQEVQILDLLGGGK
jgi:hypothetical protein